MDNVMVRLVRTPGLLGGGAVHWGGVRALLTTLTATEGSGIEKGPIP